MNQELMELKSDAGAPASGESPPHSTKKIEYIPTIHGETNLFIRENGKICYRIKVKEEYRHEYMCDDLKIYAYARNANSSNWGRLLLFKDLDGQEHELFIRAQDLKRDGEVVVSDLRSMGLITSTRPGALKMLVDYIFTAKPEGNRKVTLSEKTGWQKDNLYLMADNTCIGESNEEFHYQSSATSVHPCSHQGTLQEWQSNVAALCKNNSRLIFSVCTALAPPILKLINSEGGGFNLFGNSSGGKTTALNVASSVYGKPKEYILRWRATDNGLEGMARVHNDALLILDELGEMNSNIAGSCAYLLANGGGKIRSHKSGDAKGISKWLLLFLSSGEITLAEHMAEGGKIAKAGQEVRCVDVPGDAGADMGLFEDIHGYPNPAEFADTLKRNCEQWHGTALPAMVEAIIKNRASISEKVSAITSSFIEKNVPSDACGQVVRVAYRFALVAAAGEFATSECITGWNDGDAFKGVSKCFKDWLAIRDYSGNQEGNRSLAVIRSYLQQFGDSRFISGRYNNLTEFEVLDERINIPTRDGYKILDVEGNLLGYYVFTESFKKICAGLNLHSTKKFLVENEYLEQSTDGKNSQQKRLPDGQIRIYHLKSKILED